MLLNSILVPFFAAYFIKQSKIAGRQGNLYESSGLAYDIFFLGLTNAFLTPVLKIFDFSYFFILIMSWWKSDPGI